MTLPFLGQAIKAEWDEEREQFCLFFPAMDSEEVLALTFLAIRLQELGLRVDMETQSRTVLFFVVEEGWIKAKRFLRSLGYRIQERG